MADGIALQRRERSRPPTSAAVDTHQRGIAGRRAGWAFLTAGLLGLFAIAGAAESATSPQSDLVVRGRAEADALVRGAYPVGDDSLTARLQAMLGKLTRGVPPPAGCTLRVRAFRSPEPGAFTLPDGSVFVSAGLLAVLTSSDQLAFVLRHEAEHALGQHARKLLEATGASPASRDTLSIAATADSLASAGLIADLTRMGLGLAATYAASGYGGDLERAADLAAARRLKPAGYGACGAVEALQALGRHGEESQRPPSLFWNDPASRQRRIADLRKQPGLAACRLDTARVAPDYYAIKWPMAKLAAELWVAAREPRRALRLARAYLEVRPDDADALCTVGDAYAVAAARESLAMATQSYMQALSIASRSYRRPLRGLALIAESRGDTAACIRYLERYLAGDAPVPDRAALSAKLLAFKARESARLAAPADSASDAKPRPAPRRKDR